mmetsp:Transcript_134580/g.335816  ORF Transcript_134580/g.335816 Transcript_134580/m.335816 type:complete len:244 (-) Transcript_134580:130-861(-)
MPLRAANRAVKYHNFVIRNVASARSSTCLCRAAYNRCRPASATNAAGNTKTVVHTAVIAASSVAGQATTRTATSGAGTPALGRAGRATQAFIRGHKGSQSKRRDGGVSCTGTALHACPPVSPSSSMTTPWLDSLSTVSRICQTALWAMVMPILATAKPTSASSSISSRDTSSRAARTSNRAPLTTRMTCCASSAERLLNLSAGSAPGHKASCCACSSKAPASRASCPMAPRLSSELSAIARRI